MPRIHINDPLIGGDFFRSQSMPEGMYFRRNPGSGLLSVIPVPAEALDLTGTTTGDMPFSVTGRPFRAPEEHAPPVA